MNIIFCGEVQPLYVATDGSLQYATNGVIEDDWGEIIVRLKSGDSVSLLRSANIKPSKEKEFFVVGECYTYEVRFSVSMCYRSGQNMTILTATLENYKKA